MILQKYSRSRLSQLAAKCLSIVLAVCAFTMGTGSFVHAAEPAGTPKGVAAQVQSVNINQATAQELAAVLDGVGLGKAQAIVDHREANGSFATLEQLTEVKGIGEVTLEKNKDRMTL